MPGTSLCSSGFTRWSVLTLFRVRVIDSDAAGDDHLAANWKRSRLAAMAIACRPEEQ